MKKTVNTPATAEPVRITPTPEQEEIAALATQIAVKSHAMGLEGAVVICAYTSASEESDFYKWGALLHVRVEPAPPIMRKAWFAIKESQP